MTAKLATTASGISNPIGCEWKLSRTEGRTATEAPRLASVSAGSRVPRGGITGRSPGRARSSAGATADLPDYVG